MKRSAEIGRKQWHRVGCVLALAIAALLSTAVLRAQSPDPDPPQPQASAPPEAPEAPEANEANDPELIFPHPEEARWWLSGQINIITQGHGDFRALYSGPNSLKSARGDRHFAHFHALYGGAAHPLDGCRV